MKRKRISPAVRLAMVLPLLAALVLLVFLQETLSARKQEEADLLEQTVSTAEENRRLADRIENADTDEGAAAIARTELGLADPGDLFFEPAGGSPSQ